MRALTKEATLSNFVPDYMARSVKDIDFAELKKQGVKYVAFDADSTLVPFWGRVMETSTKAFLNKQRKHFKAWCIASNRISNDLEPLGKGIGASVVRAQGLTRKPRRKFFERVINQFGGKPEEIAMIGDKLFADIWGANKVGMVTIWVEKIGPDSPWDRLYRTRSIERRILRRYVKDD